MKKRIPKTLLPYLPPDFASFTQEAIEAFHQVTGQGESTWKACPKEPMAARQFKDLIDAHTMASREPSAILEGLWLDGLEDYPIRVMLQSMIRDTVGRPQEWLRKRPVYERAYRLSVKLHTTP